MKKQFIKFLIRWLANSLGLLAAAYFFDLVNYQNRVSVIIIGGLVLSLLNVFIKPILVIFSLPAIVLTLGVFIVIINGAIVYLATYLYASLQISSFWAAVLVGMVIGLVNYIVTIVGDSIED